MTIRTDGKGKGGLRPMQLPGIDSTDFEIEHERAVPQATRFLLSSISRPGMNR
jgi:hypothetical protein